MLDVCEVLPRGRCGRVKAFRAKRILLSSEHPDGEAAIAMVILRDIRDIA